MDIFGVLILLLSISRTFQAEACSCPNTPPNCEELPYDRTSKIPETTTTSVNATTNPVPTTTTALPEYKCCLNDSELQCCKGPQDCRPGCEVALKDNSLKCIQNIPSVKCYLDQSAKGFFTCTQTKPDITTNSLTPNSPTQEQSLQVIKAIVATLLALFILVVIGAVIISLVKRVQKKTNTKFGYRLTGSSNERPPAANNADEQDPHHNAQTLPDHGSHNEAVDGRQLEDDYEDMDPQPSTSAEPPTRPLNTQYDPEEPYTNMSGC